MAPSGTDKHRWWKESVVYQIYPASFLDANGDGWGDVPGIISKLDYLKGLGVDIIWLSPIYRSPQADMGYDISDYEDIEPRYGTLADVDTLIAELKKRGMKLVMDLVVNHTSNEHAWFLESKSSKDSSKRDWYIWKKPKYDKDGKRHPPNNWSQILGEMNSAWTWDEETQEYYLSLFTPEQPDLNWENPAVREAVFNVLRFWLDRGVSGFRMDVINLISKVQSYPDGEIVEPDHEFQPGFKYFANGPRLHEWLKDMNREVLNRYDTLTVGEMPFVRDENEILKVVKEEEKELNMIFIFEMVDLDNVPGSYRLTLYDWKRKAIKECNNRWQRLMIEREGWNTLFIENHDNPRSVTRYVSDAPDQRVIGAKLLALMQTTLSGTLYVFQGEELGMTNFSIDWDPSEYLDIESRNYWEKMRKRYPNNEGGKLDYAKRCLALKARDHSRTPVHWNDGPNAGFCKEGVKPWMRVNDNYTEINAEQQLKDDDSVLVFWRKMMDGRKRHKDVFVYGDFELVDPDHDYVFAYKRWSDKEKWLVVLNFSEDALEWELPSDVKLKQWVVGNADYKGKSKSGKLSLSAWEGLLGMLD